MSKVNFLHIRNTDETGNISGKGGVTIAYYEDTIAGTIGWAAARCSPQDNFNKAYGRAKAAGRLNSANHRRVCVGDVNKFREQMFAAFGD